MHKQTPTAVKNLRRIWKSKQLDIQFTQVTAAKELGWSQGAISHYLNAITELNTAAIIKFANFLDVDPRDIDPEIESSLPSVHSKRVKFNALNMTKSTNKMVSDRTVASSLLVKVPNDERYKRFYTWAKAEKGCSDAYPFSETDNMECYVRLVKTSELRSPKLYAARLKGKQCLNFYKPGLLPDRQKIHSLWSVVSISYY